MARKKYKFNPDTLNYESIGLTWKEKAIKVGTYLSSSFALALVFVIVFLNFYETPKTKRLKKGKQTTGIAIRINVERPG